VTDFGFGVWTQPVAGLQLSMVQGLPSLQPMAVPVHVYVGFLSVPPFTHVSFVVQALLSLHD
jgi:hypothetical protein